MTTLLVTGRDRDAARTVARAMYDGWTMTDLWEGPGGFVAIVRGEEWADPRYQAGRLNSFPFGVLQNPTGQDVGAARRRMGA